MSRTSRRLGWPCELVCTHLALSLTGLCLTVQPSRQGRSCSSRTSPAATSFCSCRCALGGGLLSAGLLVWLRFKPEEEKSGAQGS